ncbi:hypothetical protein [Streptomyces sp. NPDC127108]|uniref:hypothetical protein n=1 Tax=Streptomyces sp. NPDC127108 TaxID=3345361 RepID=UPI00363304ED
MSLAVVASCGLALLTAPAHATASQASPALHSSTAPAHRVAYKADANPIPRLGITESAIVREDPDSETGVLKIRALAPGGPGEKSGLKVNDLIESIDNSEVDGPDGIEITTPEALNEALKDRPSGAVVHVQIDREDAGKSIVDVTLD